MSDKTNEKRREFMKGALIGSGAAAVAIAGAGAVAAPETKEAVPAQPKAGSQGYHETPHVLEYYKTAQF